MNIALYLNNASFSDVDCTNIINGNPGIGGTHYQVLMLSYLLNQKSIDNFDFYLFAQSVKKLPLGIKNIYSTPNLLELERQICDNHIETIIVCKTGKETLTDDFLKVLNRCKVKIILWAHCFIPYYDLNRYAKNNDICKVVAVGHQQLLSWYDHEIFQKSLCIYNFCNYPPLSLTSFSKRAHNVVYIGSIVPLKGLHLLTKAWKTVVKVIPDANLYIIGGGNLYSRGRKLGPFGLAEKNYEKKVLTPILENGTIMKSVHFMGIMGDEKFDIINKSKVGVPNPSGQTETFGLTAVEMQLGGCLITTKKCPGYCDTVYRDSGILYTNTNKLADSIIQLLQKKDYNPQCAITYINNKFSVVNTLNEWLHLFNDIENGTNSFEIEYSDKFLLTKLKFYNAKIRNYFPFIPSLCIYEYWINNFFYYLSRLIDLKSTIIKLRDKFYNNYEEN